MLATLIIFMMLYESFQKLQASEKRRKNIYNPSMRCLCMYPWEKKKKLAQYYRMDFFYTQISFLSFSLNDDGVKKEEKKSFRIFFLHIYGRYDNITQFTFFNWSKCSKDANNTLYIRGVVKKLFYIYQMKKKLLWNWKKEINFMKHTDVKKSSHTQ